MAQNETVWTIVVAAGSGLRFGAAKQFEVIGGRRIVDWAVEEAGRHSVGVVVVLPVGQATGPGQVEGGATRSESVRRGLAAVPTDATIVCVHDAARPFASPVIFQRVISAVVDGADAAVPGVAVVDRTIDTTVLGLRKKLGAAADRVETVRGFGYRLRGT